MSMSYLGRNHETYTGGDRLILWHHMTEVHMPTCDKTLIRHMGVKFSIANFLMESRGETPGLFC